MGQEYRHLKIVFGSIVVCIALIFGVGLYVASSKLIQSAKPTTVHIGSATVAVEIVATPEARARGLSGRHFLDEMQGMLFLFTKPEPETFWMKGMLIPIDIIWIRSNVVVGVTENLPPPIPGTPDLELLLYPAPVAVDTVLETAAGFVSRHKIQPGDAVTVMKP